MSRRTQASPRKTPTTRRTLATSRSGTTGLSPEIERDILVATGTISDAGIIDMCRSSPEMKALCSGGLLAERLDSIKLEQRTGVSSFKSSVARTLVDTDIDEFHEYAAALDDKGFGTLINDPELLEAARENIQLSIRVDQALESNTLSRGMDYDGDIIPRTPAKKSHVGHPARRHTAEVPYTAPKCLTVCMSAVPLSAVSLVGDVAKDAKTLAAYSAAELREYIDDDYVREVTSSPAFSAARSSVLRGTPVRRSPSPVRRSPSPASGSLLPVRRSLFSRTADDEESTSDDDYVSPAKQSPLSRKRTSSLY